MVEEKSTIDKDQSFYSNKNFDRAHSFSQKRKHTQGRLLLENDLRSSPPARQLSSILYFVGTTFDGSVCVMFVLDDLAEEVLCNALIAALYNKSYTTDSTRTRKHIKA